MLALLTTLIRSLEDPTRFWVWQNETSEKWLVYFLNTSCVRDAIYHNNRVDVGKQVTNELFGMQILETATSKLSLPNPSQEIPGARAGVGGCLLGQCPFRKPQQAAWSAQLTIKSECQALKMNQPCGLPDRIWIPLLNRVHLSTLGFSESPRHFYGKEDTLTATTSQGGGDDPMRWCILSPRHTVWDTVIARHALATLLLNIISGIKPIGLWEPQAREKPQRI